MPDHRVVAIEVGTSGGRDDPHPAALQLADGHQVTARRAITNLRYGVESYHVEDRDGRRIPVRTVGPCPRCGQPFLRADDDATTTDRLMQLPASPFGNPILPER